MGGFNSVATQLPCDPEQPMFQAENQQLLKEESEQTCYESCLLSSNPNWFLRCVRYCLPCFWVFQYCYPNCFVSFLGGCLNCILSLQRCWLRFWRCDPCCPSSPGFDLHYETVKTYKKVFRVQIRSSGKTGGWERQFVQEVSMLLTKRSISLKVEESTETSAKDLLLVFCPIASRMGTDMDNALEGLSGDQKAILVVMHYVPKANINTFLDTSRQGAYPALVLTVHTRYTLQGGFYPCEMNKRAVGDVADVIKGLVEDP